MHARAWLAMAIAAAAGAACDPRALRYVSGAGRPGGVGGGSGFGGADGLRASYDLVPAPVKKLDILIVVDTSPGMAAMQEKLAANLPVLFNVLKMDPTRSGNALALPSLHLGVISGDTGAGLFDIPAPGCTLHGDRGQLRIGGTAGCPTFPIEPSQSVRYLIADDDQRQKNYTGDISDAASCLVRLGDHGCFVNSPLEAARWALDPVDPLPGHEGFHRPDAELMVLVVSRQDDCSQADNSFLFDPTQDSVQSALGPLTAFRCAEYGYICSPAAGGTTGVPLSRTMSLEDLQCQSNEQGAYTSRIVEEATFLKGLANQADGPFVAAIAGPPTPLATGLTTHVEINGAVETVAEVRPSCAEGAQESGLPAVRLREWVLHFANYGLLETICAVTFAPVFTQVAESLSKIDPPQCLGANIRDIDPATPVVDADCIVADQVTSPGGAVITTPIPSCGDAPRGPPCWRANPSMSCPGTLGLAITRTVDAPAGTTTTASCQICPAGAHLSGCP